MARAGSGWFVIYNHIPMVIAAVEAESRSYPKKMADKVLKDARSKIHRLTGELQDTAFTQSQAAGKIADICFPSDHAAPVEYGTYKMAARPYLYPAMMENENEFFTGIFKGAFHGG